MNFSVDIKKLQVSSKEEVLVDISFKIEDSTALIGQSGSGKSLTLKSLLNLLPNNLKLVSNIDSSFELDSSNIGFIPQNPFTSLSPMTKVEKQFFCEKNRKLELLKLVGLEETILNRFPSQLSGGQLQRVVIAIALSKQIKLLLLDEPTTALDDESKITILNLLKELSSRFNFLLLYVTHDINSIKNICKNIVIIKSGKIIEAGDTKTILENPKNEYTKKLIESTFENKKFRK
ncbi:MAG: ATP-binding cassette domain-containing protein [Halarcobacter sp.]